MTADNPRDSADTTVYLHIGCPKSGTSHIQARLSAGAEVAAHQGVYWPMPWGRQVQAVRDVRSQRRGPLDPAGAWGKLGAEMRASGSRVAVVSMEWLVGVRPPQAVECVEALAPARVELICTARDLLRSFPAHWQESMQNYRTWSWDEYVDAVLGEQDRHPARTEFWRQHDVPTILARWNKAVSWDRMHVVTVPPAGGDPELLWRRFCSVLGLDASAFPRLERNNPSLGVRAAELMQRINVAAQQRGLPKAVYLKHFKQTLGKQVLAHRRSGDSAISVPPEVDKALRARAAQLVTELAALPVTVVGDIDDLIPGKPLDGRVPSSVTDAELLATAQDTIIDLLQERPGRPPG